MKEFNYQNFTAQYQVDDEIKSLISKIYELRAKQETITHVKPKTLDKLIEIAKIQSIDSSNRLEGISTTNSRLQSIVKQKTSPHNRNESEIAGYRDALDFIHTNYEYLVITPNYILQLFQLLFGQMRSKVHYRFKINNNSIAELRPDGSKNIIFEPLATFLTPFAIQNICDEFNKAIESNSVEPLLIIPAFIHDFLCIHPFEDGNGRMSRLLTTLLLYRAGFFVGKYISIENKIAKNKEEYYASLAASSAQWHENSNNPLPFIKYILKIVYAAYLDFERRINYVENSKSDLELVKDAIDYALSEFTAQDIILIATTVEQEKIENFLKQLDAEGYIARHDIGEITYYTKVKLDNSIMQTDKLD